MLRHLPVLLVLSAIGALLAAPLPVHLSTALVGAGAGDNVTALWNVWWTRTALDGPSALFATPLIFAPFGANLTLHSLSPFVTVAAVLGTPGAGVVTTLNVALAGCVLLNLWVAYALAWRITGDRLAAVFAAVAFAAAPAVLVRVYGHLNLAAAWVLPLTLLAVLRFEARPRLASALGVALALAIASYTDYYYAIFGSLLVGLHVTLWQRPVSLVTRPLTPQRRRALVVLGTLTLVLAALAVWIAGTGGVRSEIAGVRISLTGTFNVRVAIGLLAVVALFLWKRPGFRRADAGGSLAPAPERWLPVVAGLTLLLVSPLVVSAIRMWLAGDYVSQVYGWRSAPPGVDLATVILGHPRSLLTGAWTTAVYGHLGIDGVEGVAWLGLAPLILAVSAVRHGALGRQVQALAWTGAVFLVWSLGPYVQVLGWNTGVMLPGTLLRFVPVVANARIPGRAFVVVVLMIALLAALGLAALRRRGRAPLALAACALLALDVWPQPLDVLEVPRPALYDRLREEPRGVVLEVPAGYRDGFGERGHLDHWTLAYQTQHGHPVVGGFVARLPGRVRDAYEADPILRAVFDASQGLPIAPVPGDCRDSLACPIRYVVLSRSTASPALVSYVETTFLLREIDRDADRTLFAVDGLRLCTCADPNRTPGP